MFILHLAKEKKIYTLQLKQALYNLFIHISCTIYFEFIFILHLDILKKYTVPKLKRYYTIYLFFYLIQFICLDFIFIISSAI